jgi:hypothetical protein
MKDATTEKCYDHLWDRIIQRSEKIIDYKARFTDVAFQEYLTTLDEINLEGAAILGRMQENQEKKNVEAFAMNAQDFMLYLDTMQESEKMLNLMLMKGAE